VHPILVYLEKKKFEVFNLRAIARGKESKMPAERISEYLVI
jgi:V/A-type H+-transporting ATPase subunit C